MKVNRADPLFSIVRLPTFCLHMEIRYTKEKNRILVVGYSNLFCQYEISHPSQEK